MTASGEAEAVVVAAAGPYGVPLESAQARGRLARVGDAAPVRATAST
jgi:hypothetical protein